MIYSFTIPCRLPGLNEYVRACRANRYAAADMKRWTEELIAFYSRELPVISGPVTVSFLWREGDRRRDLDNVAFAKKFILDSLVKTGALPDDGRRHVVGFTDSFETTPKQWSVTVTIKEE